MTHSLNVELVARDLAQAIVARNKDARLKWNEDGSVRILIGAVIPDQGPTQTTSRQSKRLVAPYRRIAALSNDELEKRLTEAPEEIGTKDLAIISGIFRRQGRQV